MKTTSTTGGAPAGLTLGFHAVCQMDGMTPETVDLSFTMEDTAKTGWERTWLSSDGTLRLQAKVYIEQSPGSDVDDSARTWFITQVASGSNVWETDQNGQNGPADPWGMSTMIYGENSMEYALTWTVSEEVAPDGTLNKTLIIPAESNAKIFYNGTWHELPNKEFYQNGAWTTIPASGKIRINGQWIDLHSHAWAYGESNDTCHECGATRTHVHAWQTSGRCKTCNKICSHKWSYAETLNTCTICGHTEFHVHAWNGAGQCTTCHKICSHNWNSDTGVCTICGMECGHNNWTSETCPICGKTTDKLIPFHSENCAYYISHGQLKAFDGSAVNFGSGWTAIEGSVYQSKKIAIGIRDGKLYKILNGSLITLDGNTGWTAVAYAGSNLFSAIKNGSLYYIDENGEIKSAGSVTGWTQICPGLGIASGALYRQDAVSTPVRIGSKSDWTKVTPYAGLRGGRLMEIDLTQPTTMEPSQLSEYIDWEDVCSFQKNSTTCGILGMRDGKAYMCTTSSAENQTGTSSANPIDLGTANAITYHNTTALILRDDGIYRPKDDTFPIMQIVLVAGGSYSAICGVNSDYVLALNSNGDLEKLKIR